jgi:hypothetical protein
VFDRSAQFDGFSFCLVEDTEVFTTAMNVTSNATGHDGLPPIFLKQILAEILSILTHIMNFIIMTASFPALWKVGLVVHILKLWAAGRTPPDKHFTLFI